MNCVSVDKTPVMSTLLIALMSVAIGIMAIILDLSM
jgi:hypothetical protein